MDAPPGTDWWVGKILAGTGAVAAWLGVRQVRRIDELEREKVSRKELDDALARRDKDLDRLVSAVENMTVKADARGQLIHQRIDQLAERVLRSELGGRAAPSSETPR